MRRLPGVLIILTVVSVLSACGGDSGGPSDPGGNNNGNNGNNSNTGTTRMSATIDGQAWNAATATGSVTAIQFSPRAAATSAALAPAPRPA